MSRINLQYLIDRASRSKWRLWLLNEGLRRMIPFNACHGFRISTIDPRGMQVTCTYSRHNLNHLKGIHACALATLCEFTSGLSLIRFLSAEKFRLILKSLQVEYHYQAKMDVVAYCELSRDAENEIRGLLEKDDQILRRIEVRVYDTSGNHICTAKMDWQLKRWEKVRSN